MSEHNPTVDQVTSHLKTWVNSKGNPHFAILIEGKWGSGKTHYIKSLLDDPEFTSRRKIYISMFGVSDAQDFQRSLLYASLSTGRRILHQGAGIAGSILGGSINLGGGGIFSGSVDVEKAFSSAAAAISKSSDNINDSFIVVDDLERCGFDVANLLGIMNNYVEHGGARVVFIANTDEIEADKFKKFREKIIGQSFELPIHPDLAIRFFIDDLGESRETRAIRQHVPTLIELYGKSKINNLRAVRQCLWLVKSIVTSMEDRFYEKPEIINGLIRQAYIFLTEFKLGLDRSLGILTPDDIIPKHGMEGEAARFLFALPPQKGEDASPLYRLLSKYELGCGIRTDISLSQWRSIITTGVIDRKWLNSDLGQSDAMKGPETWPSWKRLWHIYSWDFSGGSSAEFDRDIDDLLAAFDECRYTEPLEFMHAVGVALNLRKNGLLPSDESLYLKFLQCIDQSIVPALNEERYKHAQWGFDSGYDGLGYSERDSTEFKEVLKHMRDKSDAWRSGWRKEVLWSDLLQRISDDFYGFIGDFSITSGGGRQRYLSDPVLIHIPFRDFVDTWTSLPRSQERILTSLLKRRYEYDETVRSAEESWWNSVKALLLEDANKCEVAPRAFQLRELARGIDEMLDPEDDDRA